MAIVCVKRVVGWDNKECREVYQGVMYNIGKYAGCYPHLVEIYDPEYKYYVKKHAFTPLTRNVASFLFAGCGADTFTQQPYSFWNLDGTRNREMFLPGFTVKVINYTPSMVEEVLFEGRSEKVLSWIKESLSSPKNDKQRKLADSSNIITVQTVGATEEYKDQSELAKCRYYKASYERLAISTIKSNK